MASIDPDLATTHDPNFYSVRNVAWRTIVSVAPDELPSFDFIANDFFRARTLISKQAGSKLVRFGTTEIEHVATHIALLLASAAASGTLEELAGLGTRATLAKLRIRKKRKILKPSRPDDCVPAPEDTTKAMLQMIQVARSHGLSATQAAELATAVLKEVEPSEG